MVFRFTFPAPIGVVEVIEKEDRWHWWPIDVPPETSIYLRGLRSFYDWVYDSHELITDTETSTLGWAAGVLLAIAIHLGEGQVQQTWRAWRRRIREALPCDAETQEFFLSALEPVEKRYSSWFDDLLLDIPGCLCVKSSEAGDRLFLVEPRSSPAFRLEHLVIFRDTSCVSSRWRVLLKCVAFRGLFLPGADPVSDEKWKQYLSWAGARG